MTRAIRAALGSGWLLLAAAPAAAASAAEEPALELEKGAVARRQIVAVGRDVVVEGEARAGVTALDGTARIRGHVEGGVTVLGGDAVLEAGALVRGDVYVLGGELHAAPGATVEGRAVAYPTLSRAWLTLLEGPTVGLSALSPLVLAAKLALVASWLLLTILLFAVSGRGVATTSEEVRLEPLRCFATGLVGLLALTLTAIFLSSLLPAVVTAPALALVVLAALLAKLWGMAAVFHALGSWLARRARRRRLPAVHAAVVGLAVLGLLKLVPYLGLWVWTAASLIAVGSSLRTKFGRREPWFAGADSLPAAARS